MKWVLRIFGLLLFAFVLVFAVGVLVPKEHEASVRAVVAAEEDVVWEKVSQMESWPTWHADIEGMERMPDREGKPYWLMQSSWGDMPQIVDEVSPAQRLVTIIPEDADLGYSGSWTWELEESDEGTVLTITERGLVTNPLMRFVSRFVMGYHGSLRTFQEQLGGDIGQPVRLEDL